jgi:hypothetical protein
MLFFAVGQLLWVARKYDLIGVACGAANAYIALGRLISVNPRLHVIVAARI